MKAAVRRKYGSPDVIRIEDIETPVPKDCEVLIRVRATTVNRTDCANLTAKPFIMRFVLGLNKPIKKIIGTDYAGEIVDLGKNATAFQLNDRVFGFYDTGLESQAEYIAVKEEHVWKIPSNLDFNMAVAGLEGAHYAYSFLEKNKFSKGQKVLINGATGAIGSALLQFIKEFDVEITATCKPEMNDIILGLGADQTIDYTTSDFTNSNIKYNFIFDTVGKTTFGKSKNVLTEDGIYISSELGPNAQNVYFSIATSRSSGMKVIFPVPYNIQKTIPFKIKQLEEGKFKPLIDREFHLDEVAKAYSFVMSGQKNGNVIVDLQYEK